MCTHSREYIHGPRLDYIYNLHTWGGGHILTVSRMYVYACARARLLARVHVCMCGARVAGVFWYIDRAWSAISPSHPPSHRALHPISPHSRILPRPCTPTPPSGYTRVAESSCFPLERRHPSRKPSWQPPVAHVCTFTCSDNNNVRGASHTRTLVFFFHVFCCNCDWILFDGSRDILIRLATRICENYPYVVRHEKILKN